MQTVNIYFEIGRNSDVIDSSSDQTDTEISEIQVMQISYDLIFSNFGCHFGCHGVQLSQLGVVGRGRPSSDGGGRGTVIDIGLVNLG